MKTIIFILLLFVGLACQKPNTGEAFVKDSDTELLGAWSNDDFEINFGNGYFSGNDYYGMFEGNYTVKNQTLIFDNYNVNGVFYSDMFLQDVRYSLQGEQLVITYNNKVLQFTKVY